ncbi:hypothetical protein Poli38472_007464 [Pythium oligandrum]|uniref:Uncharacterized protein n=1 Tax=Pythium oligandrum TaxID=41045 RepID=A0A8K1CQ78_PYTOL|nr:hypothetical protein Poli38472_007464 [Pythium oligandrum]|eukprot:TMW67792.1 hypothetical protein Poli38472_007464 [Pythium oligandrum]
MEIPDLEKVVAAMKSWSDSEGMWEEKPGASITKPSHRTTTPDLVTRLLGGEAAFASDDERVVERIAEFIQSESFKHVLILTDKAVPQMTDLLLATIGECSSNIELTVVSYDDQKRAEPMSAESNTIPTATTRYDACVDLCCSEDSIAEAVVMTRPLGTIVLLTRNGSKSADAIPIDMNTIVVHELRLIRL